MARVRLLILTHNFPRFTGDFAGVFISLLARRLHEFDIDPVVLAPHDPGASEFENIENITVYRFRYADHDEDETIAYRGNMHQLVLGSVTGIFKFKQFLDAYRKAAFTVIEKEKIEAVSANWLVPSGIVLKTIAARTRLPLVLSSHGTDIRLMTKYLGISRHYFKSLFPRLHRWTVVSSFLRDEIVGLEPSIAPILEILPLPHDESIFYPDSSIKRDPKLIVAVTRFTEQKRVDFLIRALALVADKQPQSRLDIYGSGPLQPQIESLIAKFGLQERVRIMRPVPQSELRVVYNSAGMVVLNSFHEGFGLALSEAMLCSAPVIGTASGGIVDIVRDRETGLLVPVDNAEALAGAMLALMSDDNLRNSLADEGHRFAQNTYASGKLAARFAAIVRQSLVGK
ncbi:MAG TPA: glycosyltransferase family 4 protein [Candidatus Acidoferrum sp.]|nr:glycosyltransferase family 4 protein [Candidatus Acidoferrum sp.]